MKVKITHTARYEEVPSIVNELLSKCRSELKRSSDFKFDILRLSETATEIQEVQETLDLISSQLDDCLNLCQGYIDFQKQLATSAEEATTSSFVEEDESEQDE
jgi:hypothetical protein